MNGDKSVKERIREKFEENPDLTESSTKTALSFVEDELPENYYLEVNAGDIPSIGTITRVSRTLRNSSDWSPGESDIRGNHEDWRTEFDVSKEYIKDKWEKDNDLVGNNTETFLSIVQDASSFFIPLEAEDIPDIENIDRRHRELRSEEDWDQYVSEDVEDAREEKEDSYHSGSSKASEGEVIFGG